MDCAPFGSLDGRSDSRQAAACGGGSLDTGRKRRSQGVADGGRNPLQIHRPTKHGQVQLFCAQVLNIKTIRRNNKRTTDAIFVFLSVM